MEREGVVWNCSCVNTWKGAVLLRTVPRHRVNEKPIRTYAEQFHTELFQSSPVNAASESPQNITEFLVCTLGSFIPDLQFSALQLYPVYFTIQSISPKFDRFGPGKIVRLVRSPTQVRFCQTKKEMLGENRGGGDNQNIKYFLVALVLNFHSSV